tara:strand:- start:1097 stop:1684 length:588 start_codon:yes stop_codon:yes gene_type:complete
MDIYKAIHDNLVNSRKHLKEEWKPVGSGLERHHIIPRHIGGLDEEDNYTYLTHREHIIAHWLLWKLHGRSEDRIAAQSMSGKDIKVAYHSEESRRKMSEAKKGTYIPWNKGKKTGQQARLGAVLSEETKKKISASTKGRIPWNKGKKIGDKCKPKGGLSDETRRKLSANQQGRVYSEEAKRNMSIAQQKRWQKKG